MWSEVRRTLRPLRRQVDRVSVAAWNTGFTVAGRLGGTQVRRVDPRGHNTVLVVAAHPDDEVTGLGGTLCRHVAAGDRVVVAVVTDGRKSRALGLGEEAMAAARRLEAERAAATLRIDQLCWLGLPEGSWRCHDGAERLAALSRAVQPTVVYAHAPLDYHPEHLKASQATSLALSQIGAAAEVRLFGVDVPLGAPMANAICDVSGVMDRFRQVGRSYATQQYAMQRYERLRGYLARRYRVGSHAEVFAATTPAGFAALHDACLRRPSAVRGVRARPPTDPLAWLTGGRVRRQAARVLSQNPPIERP